MTQLYYRNPFFQPFLSKVLTNPDVFFGDDDSLVVSRILDSLKVAELIVFLEDQFQMSYDGDDLVPANLDTINAIASYIQIKREAAMNWDRIEGNWKQFKGNVKKQWGKLTDDQLDVIAGKREELFGKIQETYGISKEETEKQLSAWQQRQNEMYRPSK